MTRTSTQVVVTIEVQTTIIVLFHRRDIQKALQERKRGWIMVHTSTESSVDFGHWVSTRGEEMECVRAAGASRGSHRPQQVYREKFTVVGVAEPGGAWGAPDCSRCLDPDKWTP